MRSKRGTFTLASGRTSHYYVDGRKVTLSAEGAALIGAGVLEQLATRPEVKAVGGLTMGADPIVGATLALAPPPAWVISAAFSFARRPSPTAPEA